MFDHELRLIKSELCFDHKKPAEQSAGLFRSGDQPGGYIKLTGMYGQRMGLSVFLFAGAAAPATRSGGGYPPNPYKDRKFEFRPPVLRVASS